MALEEEFGNEIPDEEAEKLTTVGDVIQYIESGTGVTLPTESGSWPTGSAAPFVCQTLRTYGWSSPGMEGFPLGCEVESFWQNVINGECGIDRVTSFDVSDFACQIAAEIKDFDPTPVFPNPKEVRRADRFTQLGIYAALEGAAGF